MALILVAITIIYVLDFNRLTLLIINPTLTIITPILIILPPTILIIILTPLLIITTLPLPIIILINFLRCPTLQTDPHASFNPQ